jgi:hypothetical protein
MVFFGGPIWLLLPFQGGCPLGGLHRALPLCCCCKPFGLKAWIFEQFLNFRYLKPFYGQQKHWVLFVCISMFYRICLQRLISLIRFCTGRAMNLCSKNSAGKQHFLRGCPYRGRTIGAKALRQGNALFHKALRGCPEGAKANALGLFSPLSFSPFSLSPDPEASGRDSESLSPVPLLAHCSMPHVFFLLLFILSILSS